MSKKITRIIHYQHPKKTALKIKKKQPIIIRWFTLIFLGYHKRK
ncbi:MAG: hypothetical protein ACI8RP_001704 [Urechidicola sp.]|jgi:hypothetical protein